jgi:uncharacterized repeat protein (TIGR01451 family)
LAGGAPSGVPDVTVLAGTNGIVPTTGTVAGLTNGLSYQFAVQACNLSGCSPFSALSNVVILIAPGSPSGLIAVAGNFSASVAWIPAPVVAGAPPTTSYTVSAFDSLAPTVVAATATVPGTSTGAVVSGLINGDCYNFTVHATNAIGNSPESVPASLCLPVPTATDMAVTMQAPASVSAGLTFTYTITVNNFGPASSTGVNLTGTLPALPFVSFTTTQGTCTIAATFSCTLGPMNAGAIASVTITLKVPVTTPVGSVSATATVAAIDLTDPTPANNTASATTLITGPVTTDIQVGGSAQNGGPAVGSTDTFTWQIHDNQGAIPAPAVVFTTTLPASFKFNSLTTTQGTCTFPASGTLGAAITCNLGTINGGATAIVTVNFTPTVAGTFSTTGAATFGGIDTNPANNSFTVTIGPK